MTIVAYLIAVLLPLLFLYVIYALDLYASGTFRLVAACFVWGLVAFGLAFVVNTAARDLLLMKVLGMRGGEATTAIVVLVAPIVEELLKSVMLIYLARRADFTYFVDGAIYGFAAGIGFSILENFFYISQAGADQSALLVISRSFSTCLMHGSASALVGVSIGRFRYGHGWSRVLSAILGWGAAIILHSAFNRVVESAEGAGLLLGAVGIGLGSVILIALFIRWGLAEERRWIEDTLNIGMRVTDKEKALVRELGDVDQLLDPVRQRFGAERTDLIQEFLLKQAQLGIKQKATGMSADERLRAELQQQIDALQEEMNVLRREVGVYCMYYVRTIFPPEMTPLWSNLEQRVQQQQQAQEQGQVRFNMWGSLQATADARARRGGSGETSTDQG
ncbi:MAG: PrsW family intramembrane metalloprotease [Anaerolineae bacterium]|nr:PrsW family intramembrane metalloprotease [Anaerolineae bacterium]